MVGPEPQPGRTPTSTWRQRRAARAAKRDHRKEVAKLVAGMNGKRSRGDGLSGWAAGIWRKAKRIFVATTVVLVLATAGIWYLNPGLPSKLVDSLDGEQFPAPNVGRGDKRAAGYPPSGIEAKKKPLGSPPALETGSDSYKFLYASPMVAYDPCRPIHYVTRPDNAPPGGQKLIADALADAAKATGLVFIDDGGTLESYSPDRWAYQPERYGKRWAPVLIVWSTPEEQPRFKKDSSGNFGVAGTAGSQYITGDEGGQVFVSGTMQLNAESFAEIVQRDKGEAVAGAVIRHELGHVLGLDHVQDATALMNPKIANEVIAFADGDLTGLAQLGQGKCFPNH